MSESALRAISDPDVLLERIWALEPLARWTERATALDRLQELLDSGSAPDEPKGRNWRLELLAERANDAGRAFRLGEALELTDRILREADPSQRVALGRAQLAAGQALAWTGTDAATHRADRAFAEAAEHFAALGRRDWQGSALLRRGYAVWFQSAGDLLRAEELVRSALNTYEPGSPRIPAVFGYYADVLINLGELDLAEKASTKDGRWQNATGSARHSVRSHGYEPRWPPPAGTHAQQSACFGRPSVRRHNPNGSRRTSEPRSC